MMTLKLNVNQFDLVLVALENERAYWFSEKAHAEGADDRRKCQLRINNLNTLIAKVEALYND